MLTLNHVSFSYGARQALDGLSLEVPPRTIVGLLGPSGCGKTTALHIAANLLRPTQGEIVNSFNRTAIVFQEPRLLAWRRVIDNVAFGLKAGGMPATLRREKAAALLAQLGLPANTARLFPRQLSGGMRQRVAIGRALAIDPDLLLMDEPFGALDIGLRRSLQDLVRSLIEQRGLAALVVTHDIADAIRLCDRIAVLSPAPARVVYTMTVDRPLAERDESYLHEAAAALLRRPEVAAAFTASGADQ